MLLKLATEDWMTTGELGPCACSQLRRTARKVSLLYDALLEPSGLTVTQFALLVNVGRNGPISRTALADVLGMDRTTLTRNLKPLENARLLAGAKSDDRRERLLLLSEQGNMRLRESYVLWQEAQRTFTYRLGAARLKQLRRDLKTAERAAEHVLRRD